MSTETKTVTVVPAEPGLRVAFYNDNGGRGSPRFNYYRLVGWAVETDFDEDGELFFTTSPVTPGFSTPNNGTWFTVSPNGHFDGDFGKFINETDALKAVSEFYKTIPRAAAE